MLIFLEVTLELRMQLQQRMADITLNKLSQKLSNTLSILTITCTDTTSVPSLRYMRAKTRHPVHVSVSIVPLVKSPGASQQNAEPGHDFPAPCTRSLNSSTLFLHRSCRRETCSRLSPHTRWTLGVGCAWYYQITVPGTIKTIFRNHSTTTNMLSIVIKGLWSGIGINTNKSYQNLNF